MRFLKITPAAVAIGMNSVILLPDLLILDSQEEEKLIKDLNIFCEIYDLRFFKNKNKNKNYFLCEILKNSEFKKLKINLIKFKQAQSKYLSLNFCLKKEAHNEKSQKFNQFMSELQMFLHLHSVNISRREKSLPTVDILWFEKLGLLAGLLN